MRVLMVAANRERSPDPVVPLGAAMVAGAVRAAGHDLAFSDLCFAADPLSEVAAACAARRPQVVGLSLRNVDDACWPHARSYLGYYQEVAAAIRRAAPGALLVLGGSAVTMFPEALLAALGADAAVAGEGELAFPALLAEHEAGRSTCGGQLLRRAAPVTDLDGLPPPALDLVDLPRYLAEGGAVNVQTKRGCPYACAYCTYPLLEGGSVRRFDPARTVAAMERLVRERGCDAFFLVDNVVNAPPEACARFCEAVLARGLKVRWTAYASPLHLDAGLTRLMAAAGCTSLDLGSEAATAATLSGLAKPFGPEAVASASEACRAAGLKYSHSLLFGGPGETPQTLDETRRAIVATRPTAVLGLLGIRVYPRTPLARRLDREGLLREADLGLAPTFYIAEAVREHLLPWAERVRAEEPNWWFPALDGGDPRRVAQMAALRRRGVRGPLWELLG